MGWQFGRHDRGAREIVGRVSLYLWWPGAETPCNRLGSLMPLFCTLAAALPMHATRQRASGRVTRPQAKDALRTVKGAKSKSCVGRTHPCGSTARPACCYALALGHI